MDEQRKWVGGIAVAIVAVFGLWWLTASQTVDTNIEVPKAVTAPASGITGKAPAAAKVSATVAATDVVSIARGITNGTQFSALLSSTGVASEIKGGQYTIFVATDGAFGRLPKNMVSSLSSAGLKRLVQYHVVVGRAIDPDAVLSGSIQALSKDYLNFVVAPDGTARVGSAKILKAIKGSNGYVYVIDGVQIPPKQ